VETDKVLNRVAIKYITWGKQTPSTHLASIIKKLVCVDYCC